MKVARSVADLRILHSQDKLPLLKSLDLNLHAVAGGLLLAVIWVRLEEEPPKKEGEEVWAKMEAVKKDHLNYFVELT